MPTSSSSCSVKSNVGARLPVNGSELPAPGLKVLGRAGRPGTSHRRRYPRTGTAIVYAAEVSPRHVDRPATTPLRGLEDLFSVERKTVADLVGCCMGDNRERFERELHRLRGYRFKRLLVVGSEAEILAGQYHSNIKPKAVLATLCAFEVRYDLPVVFVPSPGDGARLVERWSFYFAREVVMAVNDLWRGT